MDDMKKHELSEDELEKVVGGYSIGDTVSIRSNQINYCPRCARLLMNYEATITGIRGVLNGKTIYWITRKCCDYQTSILESDIVS